MINSLDGETIKQINADRKKGIYDLAIKHGLVDKNPSPEEKLIRLYRRWRYLFKGVVLPLKYPVTSKQNPIIERCIEKNDPKEMQDWLKEKEDDRQKKGIVW